MNDFEVLEGGPVDQQFGSANDAPLTKFLKSGARTGAKAVSRGIEHTLGQFGSVPSLALGAANYLTGGTVPTYEELQEKSPIPLPETVSQLQDRSSKLTGGYTKPEGTLDNFIDNVMGILNPLSLTGKLKGAGQIAQNIPKALGIAGAGVGARKGAEALGASPAVQDAAQITAQLLSSVSGSKPKINAAINEGYDAAQEAAKGKFVKVNNISSVLDHLHDYIDKIDSPSKDFIIKRINRAKEQFSRGYGPKGKQLVDSSGKRFVKEDIPLDELIDIKKGLNEFYEKTGTPKGAEKNLSKIVRPLNEAIDQAATKHKDFGDLYKPAEEAFKATKNFSAVPAFLNKYITADFITNPWLKTMLLHSAALANKLPEAAAGTVGALAVKDWASTMDILSKSKLARNSVKDLVSAVAKGSVTGAKSAVKKLDHEFNKDAQIGYDDFELLEGGPI